MKSRLVALAFVSACLSGELFAVDVALAGKAGAANSNPRLVYISRSGTIEAANVDGTSKLVLISDPRARRPIWSPVVGSTAGSPVYTIVYELPICELRRREWALVNGAPHLQADEPVTTEPADSACAAEFSSDGTKLIFGEGHVATGVSSLFVKVGHDAPIPIHDGEDGRVVTWATWSPDGTRIAFIETGAGADYRDRIVLINADGSGETILLGEDRGFSSVRFLEWAPTADVLVFGAAPPGSSYEDVYTMNLDLSGPLPAAAPPQKVVAKAYMPTWSADGTELVFTNSNGLLAVNLATRAMRVLVRGAHHPKIRRSLTSGSQ
jgi:hypothetical protein